MTKKLKRQMRRIIIGAVVFVLGVLCELLPLPETPGFIAQLVCFVAAYFIIGGDVLLRAVKNITHGKVFDENFLMCLATIGAFCLQEFTEAVAVMLFYQVGEWFQSYAVGKSRKSIAGLMDIRPDHANIEQDGQIKEVSPNRSRWMTSSSSRRASASRWTASSWKATPTWTPPPSPASRCPVRWRPAMRSSPAASTAPACCGCG